MSITTEQAEQMAEICDQLGGFSQCAAALRSLAAERDALRAKVNGVYSERNRLAAAFARMALAAGFKAGTGVDPDETKWPVVYVETPNGQVSWHIASHDADILSGLPVYEGQWDGTYRARKADWCVWDQNEPLRTEIEKLRAALRGVLAYYNAPTPAEAKLKKAVLATPIEQAYAALGEKE